MRIATLNIFHIFNVAIHLPYKGKKNEYMILYRVQTVDNNTL